MALINILCQPSVTLSSQLMCVFRAMCGACVPIRVGNLYRNYGLRADVFTLEDEGGARGLLYRLERKHFDASLRANARSVGRLCYLPSSSDVDPIVVLLTSGSLCLATERG